MCFSTLTDSPVPREESQDGGEKSKGEGGEREGGGGTERRRGERVREGSCDAREAEEEGEKTPHQYSKCHAMCNMVCMSPVRMA